MPALIIVLLKVPIFIILGTLPLEKNLNDREIEETVTPFANVHVYSTVLWKGGFGLEIPPRNILLNLTFIYTCDARENI